MRSIPAEATLCTEKDVLCSRFDSLIRLLLVVRFAGWRAKGPVAASALV